MEYAPAVVNSLAGGPGAQRGVMAESWGVEASSWGSEIGEEGTRPSTLLLDIPVVLIFADGSGLAARMRAACVLQALTHACSTPRFIYLEYHILDI